MKRDARLCRLGERRQPHGGRWRTPKLYGVRRYATLEVALAMMARQAGMSARQWRSFAQASAQARAAQQAFLDNELRPWAAVVTADLTAKLRGSLEPEQRVYFDLAHLAVP